MTKVLLVEDDKSLREIYNVRLAAEGFEMLTAGDGEEALTVATQNKPDLILSDVMMPKISGFDMLDILRQNEDTKNTKIIMMTALSSEDQRERGEKLGADRYIVKSQVGIEDVVRIVHEVLDGKSESPKPVDNDFANPTPSAVAATPAPQPEEVPALAPEYAVDPEPTPMPAPVTQSPVAPTPVEPPIAEPTAQPRAIVPPSQQSTTPSIDPTAPPPTESTSAVPPAPQPTEDQQPTQVAPQTPPQSIPPIVPQEPPVAATTPQPEPAASPNPQPTTPSIDPTAPPPTESSMPQPTAPFSSDPPASLGQAMTTPPPAQPYETPSPENNNVTREELDIATLMANELNSSEQQPPQS